MCSGFTSGNNGVLWPGENRLQLKSSNIDEFKKIQDVFMKICFISEAKTYHAQQWLKGIADSGQEVHLISSSYEEIPGVKLHHMELYNVNPVKTLKNVCEARKEIRHLRPDIVHLFGLYSANSLFLLPLTYGIRNLVVTPWGTDVVYDFKGREPYKSRLIKQTIFRRAARVTALSRFMVGHIRKYEKGNIPVDLVPWGADTELFHPMYLRNNLGEFTIGITKAFTEKYGHVHLLEAFSIFMKESKRKSAKLVIVGKGELENRLKSLAIELGIDANVIFEGYVSDKIELRKYMSKFDVYVMPSVYKSETLGVAAIEASAMGIPVIASDIGGIPEVVENNVTGLLIKPGDSREIADALHSLMRNDEMRLNMGLAARRRAEAIFSFENSLKKMNLCYLKVAGKNEFQKNRLIR